LSDIKEYDDDDDDDDANKQWS